ncbi:MAG: GntR family transcriptional regulator [Cycloclasticus sp. symbiont of Poecilosclerida sp. M]|nr:MAG: GntR family transcriptional regulator [Cycloclasticus sp. symbiont of Poecilosclerida sp. M]
MLNIGTTVELEIIKSVDFGFYLDAHNLGEILLPSKKAPQDAKVGDTIYVFLYLDSEDRPIATTQKPKAQIGEFAYLKAVARTRVGAFLDWGLDKDILVPFAEQHRPMDVDKSYLVYLYIDKNDGRIVASSKIDKYIDDDSPHDFTPQQQVNLIIANSTDLGFKAIINNSHWGVLYKNDVFQKLSFGQSKKGFIKRIRDDGKIDLSLQGGKETRDKYSKIILNYLEKKNGFAPVHDKTSPEIISDTFGMSKGAFKKAIGGLYKQRIITISKDGIRLLEK